MDGIGFAHALPQFLGNVRAHRRQHQQVQLNRLVPFMSAGGTRFLRLVHFIQQFHQAGDDRIEFELLEIMRHLLQRLVQFAS